MKTFFGGVKQERIINYEERDHLKTWQAVLIMLVGWSLIIPAMVSLISFLVMEML